MKNVRIICFNKPNKDGLDIYIEFSGKREYLMSYRHNGSIYDVLCRGISIDELRRYDPKVPKAPNGCRPHRLKTYKRTNQHLRHTIDHIVSVANSYILERAS